MLGFGPPCFWKGKDSFQAPFSYIFGSFRAPYGESFHDSPDGFYVSSYKLDRFLQVWYPYSTCYGLSGMVTEYVSPVLFSIGKKTQTPSWQGTLLLWEMETGEGVGRGGGGGWQENLSNWSLGWFAPMTFSFQSRGFRTEAEVEVMPLPQCSAHWLLSVACNKPGWAGPLGEIHLRRMAWVHVQSLTGHI